MATCKDDACGGASAPHFLSLSLFLSPPSLPRDGETYVVVVMKLGVSGSPEGKRRVCISPDLGPGLGKTGE